MKIILNSLQDVQDFLSLVAQEVRIEQVGEIRTEVRTAGAASFDPHGPVAAVYDAMGDRPEPLTASMDRAVAETAAALRDPDGLPADLTAPLNLGDIVTPESSPSDAEARDADGAPWDERWHSPSKALNAGDGLWRAKRNRDEEAYKAWLLEVAKKAVEPYVTADEADEPVATETHALPVIDEATAAAAQYPFDQLIDASRGAAGELAGDMQPLLVAARDFIGLYGTAAKDALLEAVVGGQSIPGLRDPSERRLLQACMQNYGQYL